MSIKKDLTLICSTCDEYSSLWPGFFTLLKRYWPDFDCDVILNTESKKFTFEGFNILTPHQNKFNLSWSMRLLKSLEEVKTEYVLLMLDDFYLKSFVNTTEITHCLEIMTKNDSIKSFVFAWQPGPNKSSRFNSYEQRGRFAPYRVNAQIGIWSVKYLKKIIREKETPWQFEVNGSFRSSILGGKLFSIKKNEIKVFDYDYGFLVIKGKLNKKIVDYFSQIEKINFDLNFDYYIDSDEKILVNSQFRWLKYIKYAYQMIISLTSK